jgi:hypothetical protein
VYTNYDLGGSIPSELGLLSNLGESFGPSCCSRIGLFSHALIRSAERLNLADSGLSESIPIEIYDLSGLGKLVNPTATSAVSSQNACLLTCALPSGVEQ